MKTRNIAVEQHYDDCGEDLSSLQGADICSMAWTDTLMEESQPLIAEDAHHLECDGLSSFMLFWAMCHSGHEAPDGSTIATHLGVDTVGNYCSEQKLPSGN